MSTYILQKDTPDLKAGAIFRWDDLLRMYSTNLGNIKGVYVYGGSIVENNSEWFKEEENDDIVSLLRDCVSQTWGNLSIDRTQELFNDFLEKRNLTKPNVNKTVTNLVNHILLDKKYTEEDMRNCWNKAREEATPYLGSGYFRKDFEGYLETIQKEK